MEIARCSQNSNDGSSIQDLSLMFSAFLSFSFVDLLALKCFEHLEAGLKILKAWLGGSAPSGAAASAPTAAPVPELPARRIIACLDVRRLGRQRNHPQRIAELTQANHFWFLKVSDLFGFLALPRVYGLLDEGLPI